MAKKKDNNLIDHLRNGNEVKRGLDVYCRVTEGKKHIPSKTYVQNSKPTGDVLNVYYYKWREFDKDGNYLRSGTYDPVIDITYPDDADEDEDVVLANKDHNLEIKPGYGRLKAFYHLGLKPNVLANGDFRLKSVYIPSLNIYTFSIDKDGWTLVNAGYVITEGHEIINDNNVAYTISSGEDTLSGTIGGEAYLQSQLYFVKMGTNNQLKISVRCKVNKTGVFFGTTFYTQDVPYVKIRIQVKYGALYLQSNGSWTATASVLTFYTSEFNKYADYEVVANQPTSGDPVGGMDLDVRVYHAYAYHAQFFAKADLEAFETFDGVDQTIPNGYKTELREAGVIPFMYYYELEETSEATNGYDVVEPDDWHVTDNPRKWMLKAKKQGSGVVLGSNVFKFCVDKIVMQYLTDNNNPIDTIVRSIPGEASNPFTLEKHLIIGSHSDLIVTETSFGINLGVFFPSSGGGISITTTNTLSADLIYTGYLRDSKGVGYKKFARAGISEADTLHGILLKSMALQYKRSWRLLRGSIYAHKYFGLLNVARLVNDSNRIYMPMALTIDDKKCTVSGEFLELMNVNDPGNSGSAFTRGFKQSAVT